MNDPQSIHEAFVEETGTTPNFRVHERAYHDFALHGFTADDLRTVIRYLLRENKRMKGAKYSVRLDKLMDFEYRHFDSILCEARAKLRNTVKPATPREVVLSQLRGPATTETETVTARTIKDVMKGIQ